MKKFFSLLVFSFLFSNIPAQIRWNARYQQYIDQYKDLAIAQMLKYGIPASITLAQGLFESGAGQSELALKGNNHFGIKCHGWSGHSFYHNEDTRKECFRAYDTPYDSFKDHSLFLRRQQRYKSLFSLSSTDYRGWANGLKAAGYATNPRYAESLIEIIQLYKLYRYDSADHYDHEMAERFSKDKPSRKGAPLHHIWIYNKNYYLKARSGDTFQSIANEVGFSAGKIARYNERSVDDVLKEGEVVYLKKKQKKAAKEYKNRKHHVRAGESMYSIAQFYGIRLRSLYKMNHLSADYDLRVGDDLKVY